MQQIRLNLYYVLVIFCCHLENLTAKDIPTCNSQLCQYTAQLLKDNMNPAVLACDNFYQYACGGYVKKMKAKIPLDTGVINVLEEVAGTVKQNIISYLQVNNLEAPAAVKKARNLFSACTNNEIRETLGLLPLDVILRHAKLPLKPPFIGDSAKDVDVGKVIASTRQFTHINFPFVIAVVTDPTDKKKTRLEIRNPAPRKNSILLKRSTITMDEESSDEDDSSAEDNDSDEDDDSRDNDDSHKAKLVEANADDKHDDSTSDADDQSASASSSEEENEKKRRIDEEKRLEEKRLEEIKRKEEEEKQAKMRQIETEEENRRNQSEEEKKIVKNASFKKKDRERKSVEKSGSRRKEGTDKASSNTKKQESQKDDESKKRGTAERQSSSRRRQWIEPNLNFLMDLHQTEPSSPSQYTPTTAKGNNRRRPLTPYINDNDGLANPSYYSNSVLEAEEPANPSYYSNSVLQAEEPAIIVPRDLENVLPILKRSESFRSTNNNGVDEQQNDGTRTSSSTKTKPKKTQKVQKIIETENDHKSLAQFMVDAAILMYKHLGVDVNADGGLDALRSAASETAQLLHNIEKMVSKIKPAEIKGTLFNVNQLQEKTNSWTQNKALKPLINWSLLFDELFATLPDIRDQFRQGRQVYVEDMKSFEQIMKLLSSVSTKTFVSALWWQVIRDHTLETTEEMKNLEENYRKETGLNVESRVEYCAMAVTKMLPFAVTWNYLTHNFVVENKKDYLHGITTDVYAALDKFINKQRDNGTLGMKTIMAGSHKLSLLTWSNICTIGNDNELNEEYKLVIPHPNNFFFSRFIYDTTRVKSELEALNGIIEIDEGTPLDTTITLSVQQNTMVIPLVYYLYPFQERELRSMLLGSFGWPLAREEVHTFDLMGNEYNIWGRKKAWWKKKEAAKYLEKAECYVKAYEKFCFREANNQCVDGRRTLHENIADSLAFSAVVDAFVSSVDPENPEPRLINFETFSPLQLLTLAFANLMCQAQTDDVLSETLRTGKYPPPEARINALFQNSPEFQAVWKCGDNKPMNPPNKCVIWQYEIKK